MAIPKKIKEAGGGTLNNAVFFTQNNSGSGFVLGPQFSVSEGRKDPSITCCADLSVAAMSCILHACIHTDIHACIHTYTYIYIHILYIYIYIYIYIQTNIQTYVRLCVYVAI